MDTDGKPLWIRVYRRESVVQFSWLRLAALRFPCAPVRDSFVKRCRATNEEMPAMEQKPGRYWGVIGWQRLPLGKREDREVKPARPKKTKGMEPRMARLARIGKG
jgi:hypothetical protein